MYPTVPPLFIPDRFIGSGDIPKELGSLFKLRELLLHKNMITGEDREDMNVH